MTLLQPLLRAVLFLLLPAAVLSGCSTGADETRALSLLPVIGADANETEQPSGVLAALGGGIIGPALGDQLDDRDRRRALEAEYRALENAPVGQAITWSNERSGRSGEVSAAQAYQVGSQNCRQYTHTVRLGVQPVVVRGTACRDEDGSWTPLT